MRTFRHAESSVQEKDTHTIGHYPVLVAVSVPVLIPVLEMVLSYTDSLPSSRVMVASLAEANMIGAESSVQSTTPPA